MDLQGAERRAKVIYPEIAFRPMYVGHPLFHELDSVLSKQIVLAGLESGRWQKLLRLYYYGY
jgi:hypothetical protein